MINNEREQTQSPDVYSEFSHQSVNLMFPKDENSNPNPKFRDNPDSFNPFGSK